MDSIRAVGPLTNTPYSPGSANINTNAHYIAPQDGYISSSQDSSVTDLAAWRQLAQSRNGATSAVPPETSPVHEPQNQAEANPSEVPAPADSPVPASPSARADVASPETANTGIEEPGLAEATEDLCCAVSIGTDTLCELGAAAGISTAVGAIVGIAGTTLSSVGFGVLGATLVREGIREHNSEQIIGGAGDLLDSVSGAACVTNMATAGLEASSLGAKIGSVAGRIAAPFGLASSAIDFGFGVKDIYTGIKEHKPLTIAQGALGIAFGVATAASVLGGGIPALIISGVVLTGKCGMALSQLHFARKQAQNQPAADPAPTQSPPPAAQSPAGSPATTPQVTPGPQLPPTPHIPSAPQVTPGPQLTPTPHIPSAPQVTPGPQLTPTPHIPSAPQVTPGPQLTPTPHIPSAPQVTPGPQLSPTPHIPSAPQVTPGPQLTPTPQIPPAPQDF